MITKINEVKTLVKQISCDCKCKLDNWNNDICQCECKNYRTCKKKEYSWNRSTCVWEKSKHLKSIVDNSVIACDEVISIMYQQM